MKNGTSRCGVLKVFVIKRPTAPTGDTNKLTVSLTWHKDIYITLHSYKKVPQYFNNIFTFKIVYTFSSKMIKNKNKKTGEEFRSVIDIFLPLL